MDRQKIEVFMEMMEDRGYVILDTSEDKIFVFSKNEGKNINIFIFPFEEFWDMKKTNIRAEHVSNEFIKKCVQETGDVDCILVCPQIIAEKLFEDDYLEVVSERIFAFNPTENENVPKHFKTKILEQGEKDYPSISIDDPIVRWYGFKKGDVIKIDREYCQEVYYRVVR